MTVLDPRGDRFRNWVPSALGRRYDALVSYLRPRTALQPVAAC